MPGFTCEAFIGPPPTALAANEAVNAYDADVIDPNNNEAVPAYDALVAKTAFAAKVEVEEIEDVAAVVANEDVIAYELLTIGNVIDVAALDVVANEADVAVEALPNKLPVKEPV